jgi:hypothetical protein
MIDPMNITKMLEELSGASTVVHGAVHRHSPVGRCRTRLDHTQ